MLTATKIAGFAGAGLAGAAYVPQTARGAAHRLSSDAREGDEHERISRCCRRCG